METYTVWAYHGEYGVTAPTILMALAQFIHDHPEAEVLAITNNGMIPKLVLAENP